MSRERLVIDQPLCVTAKFMMDRGATAAETAKLLKVSTATISRIKAAGFDVAQYNKNTDERRIMERNREADRKIEQAMDQLQGQMKMELVYDPAIAEEYRKEQEQKSEDSSMMRFQAKQVGLLLQKMEKLYDMMGQILRAVRGD